MRIDLFLKKTMVLKQRTSAKDLCAQGMVRINDMMARASKTVSVGDVIDIEAPQYRRRIRILKIPEGAVRRDQTAEYYEEMNP